MVRRFRRSIYDELDELRASMDYLYQLALEPADNPLLPGEDVPDIICQSVHKLNAEVAEHDDEVTVTLDTARGAGTSKISADLINEHTLIITCNRQEDRNDLNNSENCLRERQSFSLHHAIPLPGAFTVSGASMSVRNGVLDIHLKKIQPQPVRIN